MTGMKPRTRRRVARSFAVVRARRAARCGVALAGVGLAAAAGSAGAAAQGRDSIPGVALGLMYETTSQPALAVKPFTGRFGGAGVAPQVEAIIGRDLRNSDRFEVMDSLPANLVGEGVDYQLWDRLGAVWLVSGQVEGAGDGLVLVLELHDVVYAEVKQRGRIRLPDPADPGFRMAVHQASDQIVQWATGEPGMAATRIAFSMADSDGNKDLYLIDADGENLTRLTNDHAIDLSPAWNPTGSRIVFSSDKGDTNWRIYELDLATKKERAVPPVRADAMHITPTYAPDGHTLAFAVEGGSASGIYTYDLDKGCCLTNLTGGRYYDLSPTFSPDGKWMAFNTNRFGDAVPQIMVMPAQGGDPETLSPYRYGAPGYYTSPDWSPRGNLIAFHGAIRRGTYHILVADMKDQGRKLRQLTWEGNNEDPSWAPDGRHLAFVGERRWGFGLMVVDVATGKLRTILAGRRVSAPAWSPALGAGG
jgi:TolB protein